MVCDTAILASLSQLVLLSVLWQALGAQMQVHGDMQFVDNGRGLLNAVALYLTSLSQIKLFEGASFLFEGNTGVWVVMYYGVCIYIYICSTHAYTNRASNQRLNYNNLVAKQAPVL